MNYKKTTQLPNEIPDFLLKRLAFAELKILLVIVRQTYGWRDVRTGGRKERDRISHSQFMAKTGLSRRAISSAISSLVAMGAIRASDGKGNVLAAEKRKGRSYIFYAYRPAQIEAPASAPSRPYPMHRDAHDKTKKTKPIRTNTNHNSCRKLEPIGPLFAGQLDRIRNRKG